MAVAISNAAVLLAQGEGAGRGDNPSELGGALIIVGVIVVAAAVIVLACYLLARATARRRGDARREAGHEG